MMPSLSFVPAIELTETILGGVLNVMVCPLIADILR